jgi:hypothetical protein
VGKREPAAAPIVGYSQTSLVNLARHAALAMTMTLPHATVNTKLTEMAILTSERRISLAVVFPGRVDVNLWPTQGPLPQNQVLG